ncbi:MAG TPA: efflux RND transporter periplasmic adaptor subunit [Candidatus Paceibacterota bacterium]|jgi:HlyD family secretion protein|nr:efflux RND transporter periplasmic adaptor subunit [Candidatus Paceibacterota bacterium]
MKRIAGLGAKWLVAGVVVIIAVGGGAYWYVHSNEAPAFTSYTVAQGNVVASVEFPITVAAENSAMLSFKTGGQITSVPVSEGETVAQGAVLASLDTSSLQAGVDQAQAALAAAQAQLDELQTGTRPQQLQVDESAVTTAETALGAAVESAYSAADDAVRNQADNMFTSPSGNNPVFNVPTSNSQLVINIVASRVTMGAALNNWYMALIGANASTSGTAGGASATTSASVDPATLSGTADTVLSQTQSYLDSVALAVNSAVPGGISPTTLAGYKANVVTARTEVNGAVTALVAAENAATAAQNTLMLAQAGSTPQAIEAQQAAVLQAQAALTNAQVALQNAQLIAPFSGMVNGLTATVGLVVSPGAPMLTLTNSSGLKITGYVAESDVADVQAADSASVTLDAYGTGTTFPATVTTVDTAETSVNGTPAYEVTLHFTSPSSDFKDGMTGQVNIVTAEHDNVLEVPSNLILTNNNESYVLLVSGSGTSEVPVGVGVSGNGMTEITSGLKVGDQIATF